MNDLPRKKFFILDGTSLIYRAFFAIRPLQNSKGMATHAILGFTKTLQKFINEKNPDHLVIVFDAKGPTFRHQAFENYKTHRKPMPDDLVIQLPWIKNLVKASGILTLEISGFEADDVMGSLAEKAKSVFDVFVVSPDKDMLQLIQPHVHVMPDPSQEKILDEPDVKELWGVLPCQITDFLGLVGDTSDNIPGIPGVGPKTATALLQKFKTIEEIFEKNWSTIGKTKKSSLLEHQKIAELSKNLASLSLEVPFKFSWEETKIQAKNQDELLRIFEELEFKDFLREASPSQTSTYNIIRPQDIHEIDEMNQVLQQHPKMGMAIHFEKISPFEPSLLGIGVMTPDQKAYYLSLQEKNRDFSKFFHLLKDASIQKIGYDLKGQSLILESSHLSLSGITFDIKVAAFLANSTTHFKDFRELASFFLKTNIAAQEVETPESVVQEAALSLELEPILSSMLQKSDQTELFCKIEMPLIEVLAEMEKTGIPLELSQLEKMSHEFQNLLKKLELKIHTFAEESFNIHSSKELSKILFEKLKLPPIKKTKTGYSTDASVLTELTSHHPIIPLLLEYRQISKLKSTYVDALPSLVHPKTGRLHTTFSQTSAETGRLASLNPNLQNIPVRSHLGKKIRAAFVAPEHHILLSADYSQIELRVLAHLSEDPKLIQAFEMDEDIHRSTAQEIFGVAEEKITDEMRAKAKVINFGIIYGMGTFGLSKELGISIEESKHFIEAYHQRFPQVHEFLKLILEKAKENGYVTTLFGRRRYLPNLKSSQISLRQLAERMAINTPIQGTAADLIKIAMINVHHALKENSLSSKISLQIHDELILIVPEKEEGTIQSLLKEKMENVTPLRVKLKININQGKNWMEL
ncbi:MAG: DNA polymerase I [Chlamydiae bacterium]|nr:DNA polymerase I [Chlamydiota bacterium]MBI3277793.1 DNA polymerase I [Chlamydiota bacterium]